jgi:hypothetical protein
LGTGTGGAFNHGPEDMPSADRLVDDLRCSDVLRGSGAVGTRQS